MAALQTIRNKGVLLVIIIGLALLAFVVGDALNSGSSIFNSGANTVGSIAGEDISIMDFQRMLYSNEEIAKMNTGTSSLTQEQTAMVRNNTWQQLIMEKLLGAEYKELGLSISSDELYDLLLGDNMSPMISQMFMDPSTGIVDKEKARAVINQLMNSNDASQKRFWLNLEQEVAKKAQLDKYNMLLTKSLFVTDEQAKLMGQGATRDISYIVKGYSTVSDSAVSVSDSEISDYYNANKNRFKQIDSRQIAYVNFDIEPSDKDFLDSEKAVSELISELAASDDAMNFVNLTSDIKADATYFSKDAITNDSLATFLFSDSGVYGPYLEDDTYKISRVAGTKMLPDSLRARHILIAPQNGDYTRAMAIADSLATLLKNGANFDELARANSADKSSAINGGNLGWFAQDAMVQPFADTVFFAQPKEIKIVATQFGVHVAQVIERSPLVKKVQIATIAKVVEASNETINGIYNNARTFAMDINDAESFNKKVEEMSVSKRFANVDKNEATLTGMDDAREMIRNIYLADGLGVVADSENQIIFDNGNTYTVAVVTNISEKGYSSLSSVSSQIKNILIIKKKGELIAKELKEKSVNSQSLLSIAQNANVEVKDASAITFSSFQVPGAGVEPKVIAAATSMEVGQISAPIIGNQGVYVISVNHETAATEVSAAQLAQIKLGLQQTNAYRINYLAMQALVENGSVVDERYKFY